MNILKLILLFSIIRATSLSADNRIILYLKNAPTNIINQAISEAHKESLPLTNATPGKISKKHIREKMKKILTPKLSGFLAIYGGYIDISDPDGLISFPLRHATPKIYIAITEEIKLIKVKENTISHREFISQDKDKTKLYSFEQKEDIDPKNPTSKTLYWHVQEIQIPADNKINPLTLVIFSKPSNIYIATGDFITNESSHLILPEIYVIQNTNLERIIFQTLDIRKHFEPINTEDKKIDDKKSESLIKNI